MSRQELLLNRSPRNAVSGKIAFVDLSTNGQICYDKQVARRNTASLGYYNTIRDKFLPVGIILNSPIRPDFGCEWKERIDLIDRYLEGTNNTEEVNTEVSAALPNIKGTIKLFGVACSQQWYGTGAFYTGGTSIPAGWLGDGSIWEGAANRRWTYDSSIGGGYYNNSENTVNLRSISVRFWERIQ